MKSVTLYTRENAKHPKAKEINNGVKKIAIVGQKGPVRYKMTNTMKD